jgi:tetratricopeptide (TPR) repeat protein
VVVLVIGVCVACASTAKREDASRTAELNVTKRRASTQIGAGDYAGAVSSLETLVKATPKDEQVYTMLGDAYRGLGDYANAVKNYEQAIRINYGDYQPHLKLGTLLMEKGKTGRALTEFEISVKYGDADPLVHYNYGLALDDLGRRKEALEQWRIARAAEPNNARFVAAVGIGLTGVDDPAAVAAFAPRRGLHNDAAFYNNYALALGRVGDNARRARILRAAPSA